MIKIHIPGYSLPHRLDRVNRPGGGVALLISEHLYSRRRRDLESADLELVLVEVTLNKAKFLCGVGYRPPDNSAEAVNNFFIDLQADNRQNQVGTIHCFVSHGRFQRTY